MQTLNILDSQFSEFNALNVLNGSNFDSGMYFCRLSIDGEEKSVKRMVLLK